MRRYWFAAITLLASFQAPVASAADAECMVQMGGKDVLIGPCQASDKDATGSVSVMSPDGALAISIASEGGGVGTALWNQGAQGAAAETPIGTVVLVGACWASDRIKLCVTRPE